MIEFFGSRLLRWLTVPYRSRLFTMASKPFYQIADRVLGSRFLQDIADFFVLFQAMEKGFVARAREVEALLGDPRTTFLVVSTLETAPAHEAAFLARELLARDYDLGAIIANRVLPPALTRRGAATSAKRLAEAADDGGSSADGHGERSRAAGAAVDERVVARRARRGRRQLPRRRPGRHPRGGAPRRAGGAGAAGARRAVARLATSTTSRGLMTLVASPPGLSVDQADSHRWPRSPHSSATTRRSTATRCRTSTA